MNKKDAEILQLKADPLPCIVCGGTGQHYCGLEPTGRICAACKGAGTLKIKTSKAKQK